MPRLETEWPQHQKQYRSERNGEREQKLANDAAGRPSRAARSHQEVTGNAIAITKKATMALLGILESLPVTLDGRAGARIELSTHLVSSLGRHTSPRARRAAEDNSKLLVVAANAGDRRRFTQQHPVSIQQKT